MVPAKTTATSDDVFDYFESGAAHLLGDDPKAVDQIERELSGLWSKARDAGEQDTAVYRLALSNLVILGDSEQQETLELFASTYAAAYPSRVVLVLRDTETDRLTARMSASCRNNPSGEGVVCWEKIDIRCPEGMGRSMASAVRALLIARIATVVVVATPVRDRWILDRFLRWADLMVTSDETLEAAGALLFWDDTGNRDALTKWIDRIWVTLEPARRRLAKAFDNADIRKRFEQCEKIEVIAPSVAERSLLAGWVMSRLQWRLVGVADDRRTAQLLENNRRIRLQLSEGSDNAVVVTGADQSPEQIDLRCEDESQRPCVEWADPKWAEAIIDALHQESPDLVFFTAADAARRLQEIDATGPSESIVHVGQSPDDMADAAAERVAAIINEAVTERGRCRIALAGGSTPELLYRRLGSDTYAEAIAWDRIDWFWGDERWVPHDDPQSNYRMARETLLESINVVAEQIHPMPTSDDLTPEEAAEQYEATIRTVFDIG
ncbi:MAG: hypothetical protein GF341_04800, partial [candidate division Zixibacteria bacterium]|nr:hypothetical protein [candidate division Zixibacteria bacterium]